MPECNAVREKTGKKGECGDAVNTGFLEISEVSANRSLPVNVSLRG